MHVCNYAACLKPAQGRLMLLPDWRPGGRDPQSWGPGEFEDKRLIHLSACCSGFLNQQQSELLSSNLSSTCVADWQKCHHYHSLEAPASASYVLTVKLDIYVSFWLMMSIEHKRLGMERSGTWWQYWSFFHSAAAVQIMSRLFFSRPEFWCTT